MRPLTDEEFREKAKDINPNLDILGVYLSHKIKIEVKCKTCGHTWFVLPGNLKNKNKPAGCPECYRIRRTLSLCEVLQRLKEVLGDLIEYVSDYVNTSKKCKWRCTVCGNVWEATPNHILGMYSGCPKCGYSRGAMKQMLPLLEMLRRLKEKHGDAIEYISGYRGMMKKCRWRCTICGHEWEAKPDCVVRAGTGCPICCKYSMEAPILKVLKEKGIIPIHNRALVGSNYNGSKSPLRVDFVIETSKGNLAIEADGIQHFKHIKDSYPLTRVQELDRYKDKYLKEHGYVFIRITSSPTKEWGFPNHIVMKKFFELLDESTDGKGNIDIDVFRPYDFNR